MHVYNGSKYSSNNQQQCITINKQFVLELIAEIESTRAEFLLTQSKEPHIQENKVMRQVEFSVVVEFTIPEQQYQDFCNEDKMLLQQGDSLCYGSCDNSCQQYMWQLLKQYLIEKDSLWMYGANAKVISADVLQAYEE